MANYSTAAAQSAIETLCHHVISATSELDAIVKSVDPANEKLQLLLSVTNTLQRLKQTASDLKSAITATSVVCRTIQKALGRSLQPCSNALAVVDKQLRRLQPGSDLATINPGVIARYEAHSAQNAQLFTLLARILQAYVDGMFDFFAQFSVDCGNTDPPSRCRRLNAPSFTASKS